MQTKRTTRERLGIAIGWIFNVPAALSIWALINDTTDFYFGVAAVLFGIGRFFVYVLAGSLWADFEVLNDKQDHSLDEDIVGRLVDDETRRYNESCRVFEEFLRDMDAAERAFDREFESETGEKMPKRSNEEILENFDHGRRDGRIPWDSYPPLLTDRDGVVAGPTLRG